MSDDLNLPPFEDTSVVDNSTDQTPPAEPAASATPAPTADDLFEVKINGKSFRVPREEVIAGYQRQQDYTQKTMRVAERERELERIAQEHSQLRTEREQIRQFLQDRAALTEYLKQLQGFESPEQPLTAAQYQALQDRQAALMQQQMEQRMAQMAAEIEIKQTAAQYSAVIDQTIASALEQHPELKSVRRIEKVLRDEVAERRPSTLEEAQAMFLEVAKEQAEGLRTFAATEKKKAAAAQAKVASGIEPPGGTGVQRQAPSFKLGSDELRAAFEASLRGDA